MHEIMRLVGEISGRRNKSCYYVLCRAVEAVRDRQPEDIQMKTVCAMICRRVGMTPSAAAKALSRAVDDIWDFGDRDKLRAIYGRPVAERPTPKELVNVLAQYLWKGEQTGGSVAYALVTCAFTGKYGIMAYDRRSHASAVACPFSGDKKLVCAVIRKLELDETPIEVFEETFLREKLLTGEKRKSPVP